MSNINASEGFPLSNCKCHSYTDGTLAISQHHACPRSTCIGDLFNPTILPKPMYLLTHTRARTYLFESRVALYVHEICPPPALVGGRTHFPKASEASV